MRNSDSDGAVTGQNAYLTCATRWMQHVASAGIYHVYDGNSNTSLTKRSVLFSQYYIWCELNLKVLAFV